MNSGVYQILNLKNGKRYIGSSIRLKFRLWSHKSTLKHHAHRNKHLQSAVDLYGIESFKFEVIEFCDSKEVINREQFWIDNYGMDNLYNNRPIADSNRGRKQPEYVKIARRLYRHTDEAKKRIGDFSRGKKNGPLSEITRLKISLKKKGISNINSGNFKKGIRPSVDTEFKKGCRPSNTKPFELLSPDNILVVGLGCSGFAHTLGFKHEALNRVLRGERLSHKGWKIPPENIHPITTICWFGAANN